MAQTGAFYVYMLACADGTLYTGYTTDVERRVAAHQRGSGAKYTRGRRPVRLCYVEICPDKSTAMHREWELKQLTRKQKLSLAHEKQLVQSQFAQSAQAYVTSSSHADADKLAEMVGWLAPEPNFITLDIATGGGHVAKALAPHVAHVVATDITPTMLATARGFLRESETLNVSYVLADAEDLPFLEDSFDCVTCRIAAHHFPDPMRFVKEAARVLRPRGRLLIVDNVVPEDASLADFYNHLEKLRDESHVRCAPVSEWTQWITDASMHILRQQVTHKPFAFDPWVHRMARSAEQVADVARWLLEADAKSADFFAITVADGHPASFEGLEWMALCELIPQSPKSYPL